MIHAAQVLQYDEKYQLFRVSFGSSRASGIPSTATPAHK